MGYPRGHACGIATLVLAGAVPAAAGAQQSVAATPLVFDKVTVVDVEQGKLIRNQRVVVVGNRIQTVGDVTAVKMPAGAQVVDAGKKYLIPGLWDMHVHPRSSGPDWYYPLFIANGVTGIRDAGSDVPLDTAIHWRKEILDGTRVGPPRQILSGGPFTENGDEECTDEQTAYYLCVASGDSANLGHFVDSLKAAGVGMLKTYDLSRAMYFSVAREARRAGVPFGGHIRAPRKIGAAEASDSGASIIDHVNAAGEVDGLCMWRSGLWPKGIPLSAGRQPTDSASVERCRPLAERFKRNGTWWAPTMIVYSGLDASNLLASGAGRIRARLHEYGRQFWQNAVLNPYAPERTAGTPPYATTPLFPDSLGLLQIVQAADFPLLTGTDVAPPWISQVPPGFSLHAELAMLAVEGLTPLNVLRAATLNPAKMLRGTDSLGTVAAGRLADLVLLDADPLASIVNTTAIRAVVANGRYFDRAALDSLLAAVQKRGMP